MRCQAKTSKGTRCTRQGFGDWPLCGAHIRMANRELMQEAIGDGVMEIFVITNPEPEEWEE